MKAVLSLKNVVLSDTESSQWMYCYRILSDDNAPLADVAFVQVSGSGNIYSINVSINDTELRNYFRIYICSNCSPDCQDVFYPAEYKIEIVKSQVTSGDYYKFLTFFRVVNEIAETTMKIFQADEHLSKCKKSAEKEARKTSILLYYQRPYHRLDDPELVCVCESEQAAENKMNSLMLQHPDYFQSRSRFKTVIIEKVG